MDRQPLIMPILVLVVVLGALGYAYKSFQGNASDAPKAEKKVKLAAMTAPPFSLTTLEGETLSSTDLYGSKPIVITFWATWCGPCMAEAPVLNSLYQEYGDQVQFLAISVDPSSGTEGQVAGAVSSLGLKYPIAIDPSAKQQNGPAAAAYHIQSLPTLIFIGRDGAQIDRIEGFMGESKTKAEFREAFDL